MTLRAAYTFSKDINLGGDFTNTASGVEVPPEEGTLTCETCNRFDQKGLALFDTPHVFAVSYIYRLPFFAGSTRWPAAALQGWQISGQLFSSPELLSTYILVGTRPVTATWTATAGIVPIS